MKFNKWTLGLAAVGVVSLASVAQAEEKALSAVQTALASTTISGYVDTSAHWNLGTGNYNVPGYKFNNPSKADGFNLDVVQLSIAKPLDESQWAAGYKVDLWFGPDANTLATGSPSAGDVGEENADFAIRQAYVALRVPVGNGLDFKIGVFDSILGYEGLEAGNNPNYTRSYGHSIEPQTHTGVLATYRFSDLVAASVGVANTFGPTINERANIETSYRKAESYKTYMGSIALTAPQDWGWLAGSTLYGGVVNGFVPDDWRDQTSWYTGATIATPVTGLKAGVSYDYAGISKQPLTENQSFYANAAAVYLSYQATEKLSLHARGELYWASDSIDMDDGRVIPKKAVAVTGTVQYDLWANVISRLEFRWDHDASDRQDFGGPRSYKDNAYMLALNVIYKF